MKRLAALLAVLMFGALFSGTAAAQTYDQSAAPSHMGIDDDGNLFLDFSNTQFNPGSEVVVLSATGLTATAVIGADGTVTVADAADFAGQSVTFSGTRPDGGAITSAVKFVPALQDPPAVITPVRQVVVIKPELGSPAVVRVDDTPTTPRNLPHSSVAVPLAVTGGEASVPIMIGTSLILVGGLAIGASRKRAEAI